MLNSNALRTKVLILTAATFATLGVSGVEVQAQRQSPDQGRQGAPQQGRTAPQQGQGRGQYGGQSGQQQRMPQARQQSEPFVHGISVGAGLAVYQGDFSRNPEHNPIKYLAGSGKLSVQVGADHRLGRFDQFGLGADLVYNRLSGESTGGAGFSANAVALDFYADYELPYVRQGLFRVFLGVGPNFIISPSYDFDDLSNSEKLGTRVTGSLKVGVTILEKFRIGTRISSSDLLDGYEGFRPDGIPDFVSFIDFNYRFSLK
ncbi:MAG: hypothetical protein BRD55_03400 [Bacteroidetes bacterium SW_9_63_38]|nr:MAG: hypothetical protein BRD55_03400 [Bacteroidetes bacterium SW_9_63_38]